MGSDLGLQLLQIILSEETDSDPFFGEALPSYFFSHFQNICKKRKQTRKAFERISSSFKIANLAFISCCLARYKFSSSFSNNIMITRPFTP